MTEEQIPEEYQKYAKVFSEEASTAMPPRQEFDHDIQLTLDAPSRINCQIYPLKEGEYQTLLKDVEKGKKEHKYKDSNSKYMAPVFFIKRKTAPFK